MGPYWVSTVDLTVELADGRYETMVFRDGAGMQEKWYCRYATRGEAVVGHRDTVTAIRSIEEALS